MVVNVHLKPKPHVSASSGMLMGDYVIDLRDGDSQLTVFLDRETADRLCVALGQVLTDSDPKAPALMERDHTQSVQEPLQRAPDGRSQYEIHQADRANGNCLALETWHAIDRHTGAILYSVQASSYERAEVLCLRADLKAKWECCKASDLEDDRVAPLA